MESVPEKMEKMVTATMMMGQNIKQAYVKPITPNL